MLRVNDPLLSLTKQNTNSHTVTSRCQTHRLKGWGTPAGPHTCPYTQPGPWGRNIPPCRRPCKSNRCQGCHRKWGSWSRTSSTPFQMGNHRCCCDSLSKNGIRKIYKSKKTYSTNSIGCTSMFLSLSSRVYDTERWREYLIVPCNKHS